MVFWSRFALTVALRAQKLYLWASLNELENDLVAYQERGNKKNH